MKTIHQPADKLFKDAFRRKEVIVDFLRGRMASDFLEQVDLDSLKLENSSFVTKEMKNKESDVTWSVLIRRKKGYLFFLIEHQTVYDPKMPIRLLTYNACLQEQCCNNHSLQQAPIIINIVVYAGEKPYKGARTLRGCYAHPEMVDFMLDHTFLIDLHRDSDDKIFRDEKAALAQFLLKAYGCEDFCAFFKQNPAIRKLVADAPYNRNAVMYVLDREQHEKRGFLKNVLKLNQEQQDEFMGELYKIRQEGRQEGVQEIAKRMLVDRMTPYQIEHLTGLTARQVSKLQAELKAGK